MADFDFEVADLGTPAATPVTIDPEATGTLAQVTDHTERAAGHLIDFYRKPRNIALARAHARPWQALEDAIYPLLNLTVDNATGDALDQLGEVVGERRAGRADDAYRAAIRVRILVNNSDGRREQLYAIVLGMLPAADGNVIVTEYSPAAIVVDLHTDPGAVGFPAVALLLRQAKAGGVRLDLAATTGTPLIVTTVADANVDVADGIATVAAPDGGGDISGAF